MIYHAILVLESIADQEDSDMGFLDTSFLSNQSEKIHKWFSYTEGFSGPFVKKMLSKYSLEYPKIILDPFCGSGTTLVECTLSGIDNIGVDINPFMCFVSRTKTLISMFDSENMNSLKNDIDKIKSIISKYHRSGRRSDIEIPDADISPIFKDKEYFSSLVLNKIRKIKYLVNNVPSNNINKDFFKLALASLLIEVSNLRRGPDLAYKRNRVIDSPVYDIFLERLRLMLRDLDCIDLNGKLGKSIVYEADTKDLKFIGRDKIDAVITSPPYLNGTNYFRNTKIELWILDYLKKDNDLHNYRKKAITAGINDVFAFQRKIDHPLSDKVIEISKNLKDKVYDSRIPLMVEKYFKDIHLALSSLKEVMKDKGLCIWVVGDSQFANIHIPTDELTIQISERINSDGFQLKLVDQITTRKRKSRNGMDLKEVVLIMQKRKK